MQTIPTKSHISISPYKRMNSKYTGPEPQIGFIKKPNFLRSDTSEALKPHRSNSQSQLDPLRYVSPIYQSKPTDLQQYPSNR